VGGQPKQWHGHEASGVGRREPWGVCLGNVSYFVAFDGANIWVTNEGSNNVTKLQASVGANLGTFPVGGAPRSIGV